MANNHSSAALYVCMCACACVCEREKEKLKKCDAGPKSKVKYGRLPLNIAVANRIHRPLPTG